MLYSFRCPSGTSLQVSTSSSTGLSQFFCGPDSETVVYPGVEIVPVSLDPQNVDPVTGFTDGVLLGWGVALAMVVAWAIHVLRRAI